MVPYGTVYLYSTVPEIDSYRIMLFEFKLNSTRSVGNPTPRVALLYCPTTVVSDTRVELNLAMSELVFSSDRFYW